MTARRDDERLWPDRSTLSRGYLAQAACLLEVRAEKAGNVHVGASFEGTDWLDFALAAAAIAPWLERTDELGVGETILRATRASRQVTGQNVNLGIILLLAPIAAVPVGKELRGGLQRVLDDLNPVDTEHVYQAIRECAPGGLGSSDEADVHGATPEDLVAAMRLASSRDLVARQYAEGYRDLFDIALPSLEASLSEELVLPPATVLPAATVLPEAIVQLHLELLARFGDTLIERKRGAAVSQQARSMASKVLECSAASPARQTAFRELDEWLRADGNARNPGATADLVAASLFLGLRAGIIPAVRESPSRESRAP